MKKYDFQKPSKIPYLETTGMPTRILLKKCRFKCYQCSKMAVTETSLVKKNHQIPRIINQKIAQNLIEKSSMTDIAHQLSISTSTVICRVKIITMDMFSPYYDLGKQLRFRISRLRLKQSPRLFHSRILKSDFYRSEHQKRKDEMCPFSSLAFLQPTTVAKSAKKLQISNPIKFYKSEVFILLFLKIQKKSYKLSIKRRIRDSNPCASYPT